HPPSFLLSTPPHPALPPSPPRRSPDLASPTRVPDRATPAINAITIIPAAIKPRPVTTIMRSPTDASNAPESGDTKTNTRAIGNRSEEHTSELQSRFDLVCRLLLEKKKQ